MRRFLLVAFFLGITINLNASHLMGGQITAKNIGGLTYEINLTLYRDITGISLGATEDVYVADSLFNTLVQVNNVSIIYLGNNVEKHVYKTNYTFTNTGRFSLYHSSCCRNPIILNVTSPGSSGFYVENELFVDTTNSSPVFLNDPVTVAQLSMPFYYNPLPFDSEGDSLTWALDIPKENLSSTVNAPYNLSGYVLPSSDTSMPFGIDSQTGIISFLPNIPGAFQVSVLVKEFRNGIQIGYIRRDMQILVLSSPNIPAVFTSSYSILKSASTTSIINIAPGDTINFVANLNDIDLDTLSLDGSGSLFQRPTPPTTSNVSGVGFASLALSWFATSADLSNTAYTLNLRKKEINGGNIFYTDYSFLIKVGTATGSIENENENNNFIVYPNPSSGTTFINFKAKIASETLIEVYSLNGQLLDSNIQLISKGINILSINTMNYPKGTYVLKLTEDAGVIKTTKLIIE